jgi:hypothetical protein
MAKYGQFKYNQAPYGIFSRALQSLSIVWTLYTKATNTLNVVWTLYTKVFKVIPVSWDLRNFLGLYFDPIAKPSTTYTDISKPSTVYTSIDKPTTSYTTINGVSTIWENTSTVGNKYGRIKYGQHKYRIDLTLIPKVNQ